MQRMIVYLGSAIPHRDMLVTTPFLRQQMCYARTLQAVAKCSLLQDAKSNADANLESEKC